MISGSVNLIDNGCLCGTRSFNWSYEVMKIIDWERRGMIGWHALLRVEDLKVKHERIGSCVLRIEREDEY